MDTLGIICLGHSRLETDLSPTTPIQLLQMTLRCNFQMVTTSKVPHMQETERVQTCPSSIDAVFLHPSQCANTSVLPHPCGCTAYLQFLPWVEK